MGKYGDFVTRLHIGTHFISFRKVFPHTIWNDLRSGFQKCVQVADCFGPIRCSNRGVPTVRVMTNYPCARFCSLESMGKLLFMRKTDLLIYLSWWLSWLLSWLLTYMNFLTGGVLWKPTEGRENNRNMDSFYATSTRLMMWIHSWGWGEESIDSGKLWWKKSKNTFFFRML